MAIGFTALGISLIISVLLGPVILPFLRWLKFGQTVRSDGPSSHLKKTGTPTMGGLIFLIAITATTIFVAKTSIEIYTALGITLGHGLIGFIDDYLKVAKHRPLGLKARHKLAAQTALGLALGIVAITFLNRDGEVLVPALDQYWMLGKWYLPFVVFLVIATTNTVNLTDGLDGLASGVTFFAAVAFMVLSWFYGSQQLLIFAGAVAGACLGFLVYNHYPARVFMGDTGSLALGAALVSMAVMSGTELVLPIIGGVFVIEALSVIIQVLSFKLRGKRIFLMSPIHHHFELAGWPELKVVQAFWVAGLIFALIGVYIILR